MHPKQISKQAESRLYLDFKRMPPHAFTGTPDIAGIKRLETVIDDYICKHPDIYLNHPFFVNKFSSSGVGNEAIYQDEISRLLLNACSKYQVTTRSQTKGDQCLVDALKWEAYIYEIKTTTELLKKINQLRPWQCLSLLLIITKGSKVEYYFISMRVIFDIAEAKEQGQHTIIKEVIQSSCEILISKGRKVDLKDLPDLLSVDSRLHYDYCRVRSYPYILSSIKTNYIYTPLTDEQLYEKGLYHANMSTAEFETAMDVVRGW